RCGRCRAWGAHVPGLSYGYNEWMSHGNAPCCRHRDGLAAKLVTWREPARTLLAADSKCALIWGDDRYGLLQRVAYPHWDRCAMCAGDVPPYDQIPRYTRHNEGANICFLDGHVKWRRWSTIKRVSKGGDIIAHPLQDQP
ncbi:MAG TPA: hypothetical protein EYP65_00585, partial [Armatimonadetes bacterium]|nr:hypothetical protein [Armatimonadota bacterium]